MFHFISSSSFLGLSVKILLLLSVYPKSHPNINIAFAFQHRKSTFLLKNGVNSGWKRKSLVKYGSTSPQRTTALQYQNDHATRSSNKEKTIHGSSVTGAIFNFTNGIVGAGAIGLAGAIAQSGGLISVIAIIFFGILAKVSFDLVINLSANTKGAQGSYEELGRVAFGTKGRLAVLLSKFIYTFGSLVAYVKIVQDNFATAAYHLVYGHLSPNIVVNGEGMWLQALLQNHDLMTFIMSAAVILPLCLLRDMTPLEKASVIKICAVTAIAAIIMYLFFDNPGGALREDGGSAYEKWFEIRPNLLQSLGTFVFTFVSQHTVHLTYQSMRADIRNVENWKKVSTWTCTFATIFAMSIGLFVYITFWENATSALFDPYPASGAIDTAKLLLSIMIMLTYPLAFFSCREMIIIALPYSDQSRNNYLGSMDEEQALLYPTPDSKQQNKAFWMMPGEDKQLTRPFHIILTVLLWGVTTVLAIVAPSLGDVLNLVGCATGTLIAFILPAMFSFRLEGYSHIAALILTVGGVIGGFGTVLSFNQLVSDAVQR